MRLTKMAAVLGAVVALGACGTFDAPNQNAGTLGDLTAGTPTRVALNTAVQGLFSPLRGANAALGMGQLGREAYSLDVSNPQAVPPNFTAPNQLSAGTWTGTYQLAEQGNVIIKALGTVLGMTAAEKEGVAGFVQTLKAYMMFYSLRYTYTGGIAVDALSDPTAAPPAIVDTAGAYARIIGLLDSAKTHLLAAGTTFSFTMTPGFSAFNTPASFLTLNRGIRAKVNLTRTGYAAALVDLGGSFLDATCTTVACLQVGAYNTYSTNSGDVLNGNYDPTARQRYAHGSFATDAKLQTGATPGDTTKRDARFLRNIYGIAAIARYGFAVNWAFKRYNSTTDPMPVLKNEELILDRAEANIATGNGAAALADINLVRTVSGNLDPILVGTWATLTATQQRDTLLYEKRYSLMYENGDRWVDLRRYGLLATLPRDRIAGSGPTGNGSAAPDLIFQNYKIPVNECVPRTTKPAGCTQLPGL